VDSEQATLQRPPSSCAWHLAASGVLQAHCSVCQARSALLNSFSSSDGCRGRDVTCCRRRWGCCRACCTARRASSGLRAPRTSARWDFLFTLFCRTHLRSQLSWVDIAAKSAACRELIVLPRFSIGAVAWRIVQVTEQAVTAFKMPDTRLASLNKGLRCILVPLLSRHRVHLHVKWCPAQCDASVRECKPGIAGWQCCSLPACQWEVIPGTQIELQHLRPVQGHAAGQLFLCGGGPGAGGSGRQPVRRGAARRDRRHPAAGALRACCLLPGLDSPANAWAAGGVDVATACCCCCCCCCCC
jgi:hypothetical protein